MKKLKKQFLEIRKNIPKQTQWLMLIAVFVIVLILMTLLLNKKNNKTKIPDINTESPVLTISPKTELDLTNIEVGDTRVEEFIISANKDVKILSVKFENDIEGLSKKTTCENIGKINTKVTCNINIEFKPKNKIDTKITAILIDWRGAFEPEKMNKTDRINITINSKEKKDEKIEIKEESEKVSSDTNKEEQKKENETIDTKEEIKGNIETEKIEEKKSIISEEIKEEIKKDIEDISKDPLKIEEEFEKTTEEDTNENKSESCSEFSFLGYSISGDQIGWIKPEKGSYKFYPFSDKTCTNPTGTYNPDNGIITDIKDSSKKIGTDADHIGGATNITVSNIPSLSKAPDARPINKAKQLTADEVKDFTYGEAKQVVVQTSDFNKYKPSSLGDGANDNVTISSEPYNRTFVLRQYKPIPATIVTEIKAVKDGSKLPVTATVDRNVYSDNGRTIILPTGTLMLGYVSDAEVPGPYKSIGRMNLEWYRFVRPDGVEFNFTGKRPFAGDAQGRSGVPGHGSTDYVEEFFMPMLTAIVPAAVNMIAPISDKIVNQINLDSNVVTQTGPLRSSELAKNEIVKSWNKIAQKLLTDSMSNTVPPFSIAAGTRITVYSPTDLIVTCGDKNTGKNCAITAPSKEYAIYEPKELKPGEGKYVDSSVGQVRSFNLDSFCITDEKTGKKTVDETKIKNSNYDYRTVLFYCQSKQYDAINNAKQDAIFKNQQEIGSKIEKGSKEYNEKTLGLEYEGDKIKNPFEQKKEEAPSGLKCEDGTSPDSNGCCTGEKYTDMGEQGFNCCPEAGGDCFPPLK